MQIDPLIISHYTLSSAIGLGKQANLASLRREQGGLAPCRYPGVDLKTYTGEIPDLDAVSLPGKLDQFHCRNNQLGLLGLQQDGFAERIKLAQERYASDRIGVFLGTSTSGIQATEQAYQHRKQTEQGEAFDKPFDFMHTHNIFSIVEFVQQYFGLSGPAHGISTACSSSSKVFAAAYRHMKAGLCDAAIVGGVDSLCQTTLYGFNSLQLVSEHLCKPWDKDRNGINIGEAAGFALLEWPDKTNDYNDTLALLGYGESSDAYHMSTPHPEGRGAFSAMQTALQYAGLNAGEIDYINLHGTSTRTNDAAEDAAVKKLFDSTPCSSTKGWTGHTLGAAGIVEAAFCCLAIENQFIPGSLNTEMLDPELSANINMHSKDTTVNTTLSNSFGFGGTNCSIIIGRYNRNK